MKHIIANELGVDVDQLADDAVFTDHPEMDSLMLPEILLALEDADYAIPEEEDIPRDCTVKDFIKMVEDLNAN